MHAMSRYLHHHDSVLMPLLSPPGFASIIFQPAASARRLYYHHA